MRVRFWYSPQYSPNLCTRIKPSEELITLGEFLLVKFSGGIEQYDKISGIGSQTSEMEYQILSRARRGRFWMGWRVTYEWRGSSASRSPSPT